MCKKPKIETPAVQPAAAPAPAVVETTNKQTEVATPTEKKKRNAPLLVALAQAQV